MQQLGHHNPKKVFGTSCPEKIPQRFCSLGGIISVTMRMGLSLTDEFLVIMWKYMCHMTNTKIAEGSIMKVTVKKGVVGLMVAALLLAPSLVQAQGKNWEQYKEHKAKIMKDLKLSPDESKKMQDIDEKYAKERKDIIDDLKKNQAELKQAMAASKPDESKIKSLVSTVRSDQDKLMDSFKSQRSDELGILNPMQQAKYLLATGDWRHKMQEKQAGK
jgi:Spy/CpxP family protein refolding chaperone